MSFLDVTQRLNLRPLIMSKAQIDAIIADPNYYEIAFYVTLHKVGTKELGIRTLRYALINRAGQIYNFDGKVVASPPLFAVARFLNSGVKFFGGSISAVKIRRDPAPSIYFLDILQTGLNSPPLNKFVIFYLDEVIDISGAISYNVVSSLSEILGGGGGSDIPGGANNTPPPLGP